MDKPSLRILVTGATGSIGSRVVDIFDRAGHSVRILAKDPPREGDFSSRIEFRLGDIMDAADVRSAVKGVDHVIHMAAMLHIARPTAGQISEYKRVNVDGTECVLKHAAEEGVRRFVFFSTIAVYGNASRGLQSESSIPHPETAYAQSKREAEQLVLDARGSDGQPLGTVLRLAAAYGSRVKGNYRRLVGALARGTFLPIGKGTNKRTLIYDKDVANAVFSVIDHPNAAGKTYNVTDGNVYSLNRIIESICAALGRRPPRIHLPSGPVRIAASMIDKGASVFGLAPPGMRNLIEKYTEDAAVDGSRIREDIGFVPEYDLDSGWKETIEEMRSRAEL